MPIRHGPQRAVFVIAVEGEGGEVKRPLLFLLLPSLLGRFGVSLFDVDLSVELDENAFFGVRKEVV